jgi:hypothetical protein
MGNCFTGTATASSRRRGQQPGEQPGQRSGSQPGSQHGSQPGSQPGLQPGLQPGQQPRIDMQAIRRTLELMGQHIAAKGEALTLIAVGGLTFTALLRDSRTPHDSEFLDARLDAPRRRLLLQAATVAQCNFSSPLVAYRFSDKNTLSPPAEIHRLITTNAIVQNKVLFQNRGLKILALPWDYAFCTEVERMLDSTTIDSRVSSWPVSHRARAAWYLHLYIQSHVGQPLRRRMIEGWPRSYKLPASQTVISEILEEYNRHYK